MAHQNKSTVNKEEVSFFNEMADSWWDPKGKFAPIHKFNPVRIKYIRDVIAAHFGKDITQNKFLNGIDLIDIGCGGGLLSEPFAKMCATVTGVDAAARNIEIAKAHAQKSDLKITYINNTAEEIVKTKKQFDVVLAMEIVEHVEDVPFFIESCAKLVKPGGLLFMATLNRTPKSWLFGIVGAEYIMRWLPKGTHSWKKFLKPSELGFEIERNGIKVQDITGVTYSMFEDQFDLNPNDLSVNYMLYGVKSKDI